MHWLDIIHAAFKMSKGAFRVPVVIDDADARQAAAMRAFAADAATGNLFLAVRSGAPEPFFAFARVQPSVVLKKDDGNNTFLHWFALRGELDNVKAVLAMGSEIDARNRDQQTPLMFAAIAGSIETVEYLLQQGASMEAKDSMGATALVLATQYAKCLVVLHLLDRGANLLHRDNIGCTLAHWAAVKNQLDVLRICRNRAGNAFCLEEDSEGFAPLHRAARQCALEAVEFLVETCGQDPCARASARALGKSTPGSSTTGASSKKASSSAAATKREEADDTSGDDEAAGDQGATGTGMAGNMAKRRGGQPRSHHGKKKSGTAPLLPAAGAPAPAKSALGQDALSMAEDTLRMMVDSAASGGIYAGDASKVLIAKQKDLVSYLRFESYMSDCKNGSIFGKCWYFARKIYPALRVRHRALIPMFYAFMYLLMLFIWWMYMLPASGTFLVVVESMLAFSLVWTHWKIFAGDTGALDPYKTLGPDTWTSKMPWHIFQHPFYDDVEPRAVSTENHVGASPQHAAVVVHDESNPPRTSTGEIDYEALVELQLGGGQPKQHVPAPSVVLVATPTQQLLRQVAAEIAEVKKIYADLPALIPNGVLPAEAMALADPARLVEDRVCYSCELLRPLRTKHDALSDRCYDRYDHFCSWTGTPVVRANHVMFLKFVFIQWVTLVAAVVSLWLYLGDHTGGSPDYGTVPLYSLPEGGDGTERPGRVSLLFSSWILIIFAMICVGGLCFTAFILSNQLQFGLLNMTINENTNGGRYAHFQGIKSAPIGLNGGPVIQPALQNPFDHGDPRENLKELFGLRPPKVVSLASMAARDIQQVESIAREMHTHMTDSLKQLRSELEKQVAEGGASAAASHVHDGDDRCAADSSANTVAAGKADGTLDGRVQEFSTKALGIAADPHSSPAEMLGSLPQEVSHNTMRARAFASRLNLVHGRAWEKLKRQQMGGGHGHSHGGGGHGHSHGGNDHGHSHGGPSASHGHSHGGGSSHGHAH